MTISVVQSTTTGTFGSAVTAGNTVLYAIGMYSGLPETITNIELGGSVVTGTVQLEFPQTAGAGSPQGVCVAMLPNCPGGQTALSYSTTGSTVATYAVEVAGLGATPALDQSATASGASSTIASGATGNTTTASQFIFAAAATYNGTSSAPSQGYWTTNLGIAGHLSIGYAIQTTSGNSYAWTQATGGAIGWAAAVVTITPTSFDVPPATPTFPSQPLNVTSEILLNGTWTDISPYVYMDSTSVGRGHPDESTTASPSTFTGTINNSDGRFSSLNPASPYYPYLGLNTEMRVSVPEGASYLRLENDAVSYVQGPIAVAYSSGIDIQVDMTPDNWYAPQIIAGQYNSGSNNRSWILSINNGLLSLGISTNGTTTSFAYAPYYLDPNGSGGNVQVNPHQRLSVRALYSVSGGTVTFYTGSYCGSWVAIGSAVSFNPGVPHAGSGIPIQLGYCPSNDLQPAAVAGDVETYYGIQGKIHAAIVTSPAVNILFNPDFTQLTPYVTSFTDVAGNSWTVEGSAEVSARKYRFHGQVAAWPQSWSPNGANATVALSAGGLLRRMGQAEASVNSPMYRAYTRGVGSSSSLAAYWPMEDMVNSTSLASGIGGVAMAVTGSPKLSSSNTFVCSNGLPVINGASLFGKVPPSSGWTANSTRWLMQLPAAGDTNGAVVASIVSTGTVAVINVDYSSTSGGFLTAELIGTNGAGLGSITLSNSINGALVAAQVDVVTSGSNVVVTLSTLLAGQTTPVTQNLTVSGSAGSVQQVLLNPVGAVTYGGLGTTVFGHLGVYSAYDPITAIAGALDAWQGEPAGLRFQRLCAEESIQFRGMGYLPGTVLMGIQTLETVASLLQECADADRGMWFEPRQCLGFGYRTRVSIGNQAPWLTFDYNQDHLSDELLPTQDDQVVKNDITVSNQGDGSTAEVTLNDGSPLSIGVIGRYDTSITVNLAADSQLLDEAGWILHSLTTNELRYTAVNCDMANNLSTLQAMFYQILDADMGDRINVLNPPAWIPPGVIDQIIQGGTETLSLKDLVEAWTGVPSTPYNVMYFDDSVYGRFDTDGSTLATADPTGTATSLSIATTTATSPLWTTAAADFPLNVIMGGEVMTVTNITGSSSPQTFTVTRSVNGIVKPQAAGTDVRLAVQPTISL